MAFILTLRASDRAAVAAAASKIRALTKQPAPTTPSIEDDLRQLVFSHLDGLFTENGLEVLDAAVESVTEAEPADLLTADAMHPHAWD